jgi:hypothetical protein
MRLLGGIDAGINAALRARDIRQNDLRLFVRMRFRIAVFAVSHFT